MPLAVDPDSGVPVERVLHPPAVHFKGKGFYNTDYGTRNRQRETAAAAEKSSSDELLCGGRHPPRSPRLEGLLLLRQAAGLRQPHSLLRRPSGREGRERAKSTRLQAGRSQDVDRTPAQPLMNRATSAPARFF